MADETPAAEKMLTLNLEWGNMDTAMVTLAPGKSTQWHVRLGLFVP